MGSPVTTVVYRGLMRLDDWGEGMDVLFVDSVDEPLAEQITEDIDTFGRYLSVRYATGPTPVTDLDDVQIRVGEGDAECHHVYSDITGYLWTNEEIVVGGHDLLEELTTAIEQGRPHLWLEITYSPTPAAA